MKALYLKFASESEAQSVLYSNDEPLFRNIDIIGTIYEPQTDEDTLPVALDGWHVNVMLTDDEDGTPLIPFETQITSPRRTWASVPVVQTIPSSVTRRQARQALLLSGLMDGVQTAINNITDPINRGLVQIEWDDSLEFHRDREALIMLAQVIGLDEEQLDNLFIQASKL